MFELYGFAMSTNARKIHWALEELGAPYQFHNVDLLKGEHQAPPFLELNPRGRVPVVVDDGFVLRESNAILWYLGDKLGRLLPSGPRERAVVAEWLSFQGCHYGPALERPWRMKVVSPLIGEPHDPVTQAQLCAEARPRLEQLDAALTGRRYIAGDQLSIADISLAEPTGLAAQAGIDLAPYPHLRAWMEGLSARPAFQKTRPRG